MSNTRGTPAGRPPGGEDHGSAEAGGADHRDKTPPGVTAAAYVALFLLGALLGLLGTFQYSRGPGPLAAILFDLGIFAACALGATGMRTALGGALPAAGWFVVTLALSTGTAGGSILITDTTPGKWFLFGGAVCAAGGAVYAFALWSRASRDHRASRSPGPHPERGAQQDRSRQDSGSARDQRRTGR